MVVGISIDRYAELGVGVRLKLLLQLIRFTVKSINGVVLNSRRVLDQSVLLSNFMLVLAGLHLLKVYMNKVTA